MHSTGTLQLFFALHDKNQDGNLTREETISLSETFLFLFRKLEGDAPLGAVSSFLNRAFMVPVKEKGSLEQKSEWHLSMSTFQEVIVADDFLVEFLASFKSTFILHDVKSGVYTNVKAPPVLEISESILSDGLKWATKFISNPGKKGEEKAHGSDVNSSPGKTKLMNTEKQGDGGGENQIIEKKEKRESQDDKNEKELDDGHVLLNEGILNKEVYSNIFYYSSG